MTVTATLPARVRVFVVGAGFAGLGAAIKLDESGFSDFVVADRGATVGGTWRDNTYPGAACDVPSQLYSFSFAPNADWSRSFSPSPRSRPTSSAPPPGRACWTGSTSASRSRT